jgi:hypothetical protein
VGPGWCDLNGKNSFLFNMNIVLPPFSPINAFFGRAGDFRASAQGVKLPGTSTGRNQSMSFDPARGCIPTVLPCFRNQLM